MNAPNWRARGANRENDAPAPVRRVKGNPIRRHWLTGAFAILLVGSIGYAGMYVYQTDQELQEVLREREEALARLHEMEETNLRLQQKLEQMTSDGNMELMAKKMGFTMPNEKVYQTSPNPGQ